MHLVVELESVVGVCEVLFCQFFVFVLRFDPVKQLCSLFLVFRIRGLVGFESFIVSLFFFLGSPCVIAKKKKTGKIITANERHSVKHSATSHDSNTCHAIYKLRRFKGGFFDPGGTASERWRQTSRYKLYVVHGIAAGIRSEVFFDDFFRSPAKDGGQAGKRCGIENRVASLLSDIVDIM